MFGFLKKKLKAAVDKFTQKASEEVKEEVVEATEEDKQAETELLETVEEPVEEIPETPEEKQQHRKEKAIPKKVTSKPKKKESEPEKEAPKQEKAAPEKVIQQAKKTKPEKTEKQEAPKEKQPATTSEPQEKTETSSKEDKPVTEVPSTPEKKPGMFSKLFKAPVEKLKESFTKKTLSPEKFEELFSDLEIVMMENNVAVEVIDKIKADLEDTLTSGKISRLNTADLIKLSLHKSIEEVLTTETFNLLDRVKEKQPFVITFIGVNGTGKTTTLAKIANLFKEEGLEVVLAASDTFRAAAIDQLKEHANTLGVKLISQGYGADPAAVAFDAIEHAKARGADVVMIDTAGRLHSNTNLMAELGKVIRVAKPDLKIFIGESITGNDCVEQAKEFDRIAGIDAIILSKADVDDKGGAAISVSYITKKPILYLGVGQAYGDLKKFDKHKIIESLGL